MSINASRHSRFVTASSLAAMAVLSASAVRANPGDGWQAVSWGGNPTTNSLWDYTEGSGVATNRRLFNLWPNGLIHGIDYGLNGVLYAAATFNDFGIYTVAPNGSLTHIASIPGVAEGGVAHDPVRNRLLVSQAPFSNHIYEVDLANGNAVSIFYSATNYDDIQGLAFDAAGDLWALHTRINSTGASELLKWNGAGFTSYGALPAGMGVNAGMDFNHAGELHILSNGGALYEVTPTFGAPTLTFVDVVSNSAGEGYTGLTYVPAPGALGLLAAASLFSARRGPRR